MDTKASQRLAADPSVPSASGVLDFLELMHNLKATPRAGWVQRNVAQPESIADHMYRMATMALLMAGSERYDHGKLVKMAIVHDIAEAIVGDITPDDNVSKDDKREQEAAALERIQGMLGHDTAVARELGALWWEYERAETPEAQICKDFDKLEMIIQASEYERLRGAQLQEFFDSTRDIWRTDIGLELAAEVLRRRQV